MSPSVKNIRERRYLAISIVFSLIYSLFLAGLPINEFVDRDNYINYVTNSISLAETYLSNGVVYLLSNEPLWLLINIGVGALFAPDTALRIIIFSSALFFSFFILQSGRGNFCFIVFAIMICLLPQVMKNYVVHLRQGVAIAVAAVAFTYFSSKVQRTAIATTPFIHASFFFLLPNFLLSWVAAKNKIFTREFTFWGCLILSCLLMLSSLFLLSFVEARQISEYQEAISEPRSGMAFLFWSAVLLIFIFDNICFRTKHLFSIAAIANYLVMYFLFDPAARIFESALPFVLLSGYQLEGRKRIAFFILFVLIFIYQWLAPLLVGDNVFRLAL